MTEPESSREMTLREWVEKLPSYHSARKEFFNLVDKAENNRELTRLGKVFFAILLFAIALFAILTAKTVVGG